MNEYHDKMHKGTVTVQNQVGLHARPATFFIRRASEFQDEVWIERNGRRVNAKSLLGILSLGIVGGTKFTIISEDPAAVDALVELVESGFQERK